MPRDPYQYFRPEARDLTDQLGRGVLELEKRLDADVLGRLLRLAHTLKGAARVVKQKDIADHAHAIEDALEPFREGAAEIPRHRIDAILALVDEIRGRVDQLTPAVSQAPASLPQVPPEADVTVDASREIDVLLDGVLASRSRLGVIREAAQSAVRARGLADTLVRQATVRAARAGASVGTTPSSASMGAATELRRVVDDFEREVTAGADAIDRELDQMREATGRLRLTSVGTMFGALERTVRDTAQALGKRAMFEGTGGDFRLEPRVHAALQRALIQAVRNAVAHGIEDEAGRLAAGKTPTGRVTVEVEHRGRFATIRCRDDGRGIDVAAVRSLARGRGLDVSDEPVLSTAALTRLLLHAGISTAEVVTEISGRGVGLDVMRVVAEELRGEISIHTEAGRGTVVELAFPLSLTSVDTLIAELDGDVVAVPLRAIRRTLRLRSGDVRTVNGRHAIVVDGAEIRFASLRRVLRRPETGRPGERSWSAAIVEADGQLAALGVDRFVRSVPVAFRPLPPLAPADPAVAGVYLDGQGVPQLVLSAQGFLARVPGEAIETMSTTVRRPILVVDDSLTTRMLERSILESAGFEVDTADSAEQALERAAAKTYALILVDVEMPGMNGFTFVERIRADPALHDVPAILVTSRDAPEDRQRGRDVGAQSYVVKSEFNQADLVSRIEALLHGA